jgi:hypothetical protein
MIKRNYQPMKNEKEYYSYIHPNYPFIRSNCNQQMVKALLQTHIFPDRMRLEEELYILDKHKIHPGLWLKSDSARRLIQFYSQKAQLQTAIVRKYIKSSILTNLSLLVYDDILADVTLMIFCI